MQRVRIGLTGLAFVFVAVLLAAALIGRGPIVEPPITTNEQVKAAARNGAAPQQEPLADLGVAPGNGGNSAATNQAGNR